MKPPYESLAAIGQATEQIAENIEHLKESGLLAPELADIRKLTAQQLRAEIAVTAILNLAERETKLAAEIEKEKKSASNRIELD